MNKIVSDRPEEDYRAAWLEWRFGTKQQRQKAANGPTMSFVFFLAAWVAFLAVGFIAVMK